MSAIDIAHAAIDEEGDVEAALRQVVLTACGALADLEVHIKFDGRGDFEGHDSLTFSLPSREDDVMICTERAARFIFADVHVFEIPVDELEWLDSHEDLLAQLGR